MKLIILGSGGAMPTPRPFCQCKLCTLARADSAYKRNNCSAFVEEINALIDCPEDIGDSLNRQNIKQVDNLFITHWHPDHTFGLRVVLEANFNFIEKKADKCINIFIGKGVYETLKEKYPSIDYYVNVLKVAKINFIEDGDILKIKDIAIKIVGYSGKRSEVYAFLFKVKDKSLLYAPCDTISFKNYSDLKDLDILVHECGIFSHDKVKTELSFPALIERIKEIKPKRTILTHIEEIELNRWGPDHLNELKNKYKEFNIEFGYDGLELNI